MAVEFQPTQFQPVTFYDLPTLAFSQVMEGEFTVPGFFSGISEATGIGNATLTPTERESIVDQQKQKHGLTGISGALADIATNPWVWFAFLTTPGAVSALRNSTKGIFKVSPEWHVFNRENAPWLIGWRFLTGNQIFRNTHLHPAMTAVAKERNKQIQYMEEVLQPAREEVLANLNSMGIRVKTLDPTKAPVQHRDLLKDIDIAIHGRLAGKDRATKEVVSKIEQEMGEFTFTLIKDDGSKYEKLVKAMDLDDAKRALVQTGDMRSLNNFDKAVMNKKPTAKLVEEVVNVDPIMSRVSVDETINKYGLQPMIDSMRNYYDEMGKRLFLNEDLLTRNGITSPEALRRVMETPESLKQYVDKDKVVNLWKSAELRSVSANAEGEMSKRATEAAGDLFSVSQNRSDNPGLRTVREIMNFVDAESRFGKEINFDTLVRSEDLGDMISRVVSNNMAGGKYHPKLYDSVDGTGRSLLRKAVRSSGKKTVDQAIAAGHVLPKNPRNSFGVYSAEDIEALKRLSNNDPRLIKRLEKIEARLKAVSSDPTKEGMVTVQRLGAHDAVKFYGMNSANTYATFIHGARKVNGKNVYDPEVWSAVSGAQKGSQRYYDFDDVSKGAGEELVYNSSVTKARNRDVLSELPDEMQPYNNKYGYFTLGDAINQVHGSVREPGLKGIIKDVLVPQMLGRQTIQHSTENLLAHSTAMAAKKTAGLMRNMGVDKTDLGAGVVKKLEEFHDSPMSFIGSGTSGGLARYLYITHLGFNPASVILNLTQPWLLGATQMGVGPIIKGYGQAFKEMGNYLIERLQSGKVFATDAEKALAIKNNFKHAEEMGISPDTFRNLDEVIHSVDRSKSGLWDRLSGLSMKVFEKAEWMNRSVVSHAADDLFKTTGAASSPFRRQAVREMIQETQFGADFLNTPMTFMGYGSLGQWFGRPEMRQFLTFPLRSVTGIAVTSKQINEGRRKVMGFDVPFGRTVDFIRGLGVSAGLYYAGRNMFEADMSKALFYNSMTDIIGNDPFNDYENATDFIPVPPVIDMGYDAIRGITSGDTDLLANGIWRMVPGGIALSRAFATAPQYLGLPSDNPLARMVGDFQKRYASYDNPSPTGEIPIFKGDGTFVEFRNPMQLVLQGLGLDLNASKVRSEETGYYVKQREMILQSRQEIISKLLANDIPGAMKAKARYEKRMGIPFSLTKEQLRQFMRNRQVPRNERILDRIPPEARHLYSKFAAADMVNKDVDPSVFVDAPTSSAQSKVMERPQTFDVQAESIAQMRELIRETEERKRLSEMGFTNFTSFGE